MVYDIYIYIYQVNGNGILREYSMDGCGIYIYTPLEHQVQSLESLANPRTIAGYSWMWFF